MSLREAINKALGDLCVPRGEAPHGDISATNPYDHSRRPDLLKALGVPEKDSKPKSEQPDFTIYCP